MKLDEWGNLILSWANFLDPNEEIVSLEDLTKSDLFPRLLGSLRCPIYDECPSDWNEMYRFLQCEYPLLDLDSTHRDNKQGAVLLATAFLIYCSLHHEENELQKKMTKLPNWTQLCLSDFLQEFVEIPKTEITQKLIYSEISKISSSRIPKSAMNSPNFGTPVMYSSSPSTEGSRTMSSSKKTSRIKKLRKEVDMLTNMKGELTEELEAAKEKIIQLESSLQKKEQDMTKLKSQLHNVETKFHVCDVPKNNSFDKSKVEKLKVEVKKLEEVKLNLEDELYKVEDEKSKVHEELQRVRDKLQHSEIDRKMLKQHQHELEEQIKELKNAIEQLTLANKEQSEYISELTRLKDDSKTFSDSHNDSLILPESLGQHVIDLEIGELKEIIENKDSKIMALEKELKDILATHQHSEQQIVSLNKTIKKKGKELESSLKTIVEKDSVIVSIQSSIDLLKEEIISLKNNQNSLNAQLQNKTCFIEKLLLELDNMKKSIQNYKEEKELLQKTINLKENAFKQCACELTEVRKHFESKMSLLQDELSEKSSMCKRLEELRIHLNSELSSSKEQNIDLKANIDTLVSQCNSLAREKLTLEENISGYVEVVKSLEDNFRAQEQEIAEIKEQKGIQEEKLNNTIEQLKSEISKYTYDLNALEAEKNHLKDEIINKTVTIESYESKIKFCETINNTIKGENMSLMEELCSKKKVTEELESKIDNYVIEMAKLSNENAELCSKCEILTNTCNSKMQVIDSLQKEIEERAYKESILLKEINNKNDTISKLQESIQTLQDTLNDFKSESEQLHADIRELNVVVKDNGCEILELRNAIEEKENILELMLEECNQKIIIFQESEKTMKDKILLIEQELAKSNSENYKLTIEVQNKTLKIENLNEILLSKENELSEIKSESCNMSEEIQKKALQLENLEEKISIQDKKLAELKIENSTLTNDLQNIKLQLEISSKEVSLKDNELAELKLLNSDMSDNIQNKTLELISLDEKLLLKEKELAELKIEHLNISAEMYNKSTEIGILNEKVTLLEKDLADLKTENCKKTNEIQTKNLDIENKTKEILSMKKELEECLFEIKTLKDDSLKNTCALNSEIDNYKILNNELVFKKEILESEIQNICSEKENILDSLKGLQIEHSGCSEKVQYLESVIHELKDKENILKEELCKSNKREAILETEVSNKSILISELKEEAKKLHKSFENCEFKKSILFTKLQAKEAEVNQMILELNDLNKKFRTAEEKHQEETKLHINKIHDLDSTIGRMNNQFIKINIEKESLITELDNRKVLESDFKKLQLDFESLKVLKETLEEKLNTDETELSKIRDESENLRKLIQDLNNEKLDLSNMVNAQLKELNSLRDNVLKLQHDISESKTKEADLCNELVLKNTFISKLENEISDLKQCQEQLRSQEVSLKESLKSKDSLVEKYAEEKNVLKLDLDLCLRKEADLKAQLERKQKEIEEMYSKHKLNEDEIGKLKVKCSEQEETLKGLYATLHSQNSEIKDNNSEIALLQDEIKNLNQLIERNNDIGKPELRGGDVPENQQSTRSRAQVTEEDMETRISQLKATYEKKVEAYKAIMKKRFVEKLEDMTYTLQNENTDLKEKLLKQEERCAKLQSELWNASDKLLISQEQNRTLLAKFQNRNMFEVLRPSEPLSPISKARSMEVLSGRNRGIDNFARDISMNESDCSSRRSSIRSLPRGMGKVFPAADEDGEVFDNRNLADLKNGVCNVQSDPDRLSTFQYRNSLCPPHLKSSYPLETQFLVTDLREDDIKSGARLPQTTSSEGDIRRTKLQSSYKKPGPPTPSKSAAQLSQGSEKMCPMTPKCSQTHGGKEGIVNETFVLRESNSRRTESVARPMKISTPSRIKALFSNKRDENSPRRKSMFLRKN